MIITLPQVASELSKAASNFAIQYSVSVLTLDQKNRPNFIGSGVFIKYKDSCYCITASHVLSEMHNGIFVGKDGMVPLNGIAKRTRQNEKDLADVAYWKVDEDFPSQINANVVDQKMFVGRREFQNSLHCVCGYPGSKNKLGKAIEVDKKKISSYCLTFSTAEAEIDFSLYKKKHKDVHVALWYETALHESGKRNTPPSPAGMSGAPTWVANSGYEVNSFYLEGILIEYHKSPEKVVFCTKISHVSGFIDDTNKA